LHAGIGYVTPDDEHEGRGPAIRRARVEIRLGASEHTLARLTTPTEFQAQAFDLLNIKPA
jgi:hypothetical protein